MRHRLWTAALLLLAATASQANPAGLWKTIDDETQAARSLVRITASEGVWSGRIERLLGADANPKAVCALCTDERKGQPLVGLSIIRNMKASADDAQVWEGGDITDPDNGKVYRLRLRPLAGGKQLEVRGYIGPFYRTQTWFRVE